jgi:hypothetical protein
MNPSNPHDPWARLTDGARRAPADSRDATAPYGFATRLTALAFAAERPVTSLIERFSWRALGFASLLALASVAANYSVVTASAADEELSLAGEDPVAVLLDTP